MITIFFKDVNHFTISIYDRQCKCVVLKYSQCTVISMLFERLERSRGCSYAMSYCGTHLGTQHLGRVP